MKQLRLSCREIKSSRYLFINALLKPKSLGLYNQILIIQINERQWSLTAVSLSLFHTMSIEKTFVGRSAPASRLKPVKKKQLS